MAETVDAVGFIREGGGRSTRTRRAVWDALNSSVQHQSAASIHDRVAQTVPSIARSTVYRTLTLLEERGLVHSVAVHGEVRFGPVNHPHHHGVCIECGTISELDHGQVNALLGELEAASGIRPDAQSGVTVRGLCQDCRTIRP